MSKTALSVNAEGMPELSRAQLIAEAGRLNNHPELVNTDHVTFMALLDRDECQWHVEKLRARVAGARR